MKLPPWSRDWRVYAGGGLVGAIALVLRAAPSVGAPRAAASSGGPFPIPDSVPELVARPGRLYFATVTTHGAANVATTSMVASFARKQGFADVVVASSRPAGWPGSSSGDFFVRGTFAAAVPKSFARHTSILLGSVDVLDVWEG